MPTLASYGQTTPINQRTAGLISDQQDQQHRAQVDLNQATGQTVGANMNIASPIAPGSKLQAVQTTYNAKAAGIPTSYNTSTGVTSYVDPGNGAGLNQVQRQQLDNANTQAALLKQQAATETAKRIAANTPPAPVTTTPGGPAGTSAPGNENQTGGNTSGATPDNGATPSTTPGSTTPTADPLGDAMKARIALEEDPKMKAELNIAYQEHLQEMSNTASKNAALQAKEDQATKDEATAKDAAAATKAQTDADNKKALKDQQDFNAKQENLDKMAADNANSDAQDKLQVAKDQASLDEHIAYNKQSVLNDQTEMQNRNAAAKLGINFDTGGMQWMMTEKQKGLDALDNISKQMALNDANFSMQAAKIARDYTQNIFQVTQTATQNNNAAVKTYNDSKRTATTDYSSTTNSINQYYQKLKDDYAAKIDDNTDKQATATAATVKDMNDRIDKLTVHKDALETAANARADRLQAHKDAMIQHQDTAAAAADSKAIEESDKASAAAQARLKDPKSDVSIYQETSRYSSNFNDAYNQYSDPKATGQDRAAATAQAMFQFSHGQNPGSLRVQDIAAEETIAGLSLGDKARNEILHWTQGGTVSRETLDAMKGLMDNGNNAQKQKALLQIVSVWHDVNRTNLNLPRQSDGSLNPAAVTPEQITGDPDLLNAIHQEQDKETEDWLKNNQPMSSNDTRADRNKNPTAMTTAVAKDLGLQEGVDYIQGDQFPVDPKTGQAPNLYTAKLIGDPIETTIRGIDQGGLTTSKGSPRWTYLTQLGLTNEKWKQMSPEEKTQAVGQMYAQEGGTQMKNLFAMNTNS